jgi:hypothetical protein
MVTPPGYQPPTGTGGLQIIELLPHASSCSPLDNDLLCSDYIKLFNSADVPVNLANYRLRTSYGGLSSSSRNTFTLDGSLDPGQYDLVNTKDDGTLLSLTQSGGYVWLEDVYGVQAYDPVIEYPDASSGSKVGQTWAFDGTNWQWTATPQPEGPNIFPDESADDPVVAILPNSSLKPCAPNQVRNLATNRCRRVSTTIKTLIPCKPGQVRSAATNRCRSIKTSTKSLTPCKLGQTRNPATNRCRSITTSTKTKKPCKPGQERNPDTGRCRKIQPKVASVHDIKTASKKMDQHWYLAAVLIIAACAYILYEWRQELSLGLEKIRAKSRFTRGQKVQNLLK